jgi:aminopeptidase N
LINDALALARSGYLEIERPFQLISYLNKETEYLPWTSALNGLDYISDMIQLEAAYGPFESYLVRLIRPIYNTLNWNSNKDESWLAKKLRTSILSSACLLGIPECTQSALRYFQSWFINEENNL